jgi:hypothetical protein
MSIALDFIRATIHNSIYYWMFKLHFNIVNINIALLHSKLRPSGRKGHQ